MSVETCPDPVTQYNHEKGSPQRDYGQPWAGVSRHVGTAWPRSFLHSKHTWGTTTSSDHVVFRARDHLCFLPRVTGHNMQSGLMAGPKLFFCSFPLCLVFPTVRWLCIGRSEGEHCLTQTVLEAYGKSTNLGSGRCFLANALLLSSVLSSSKLSKFHHILSNWAPTLEKTMMYFIPNHQDTNSKWSQVSGTSSPSDTS